MTTRGKVLSLTLVSFLLAACGGKAKPPPPPPPPPVAKPAPPPPPPPPVCIPPSEPAMVTMATADAAAASFCVGDGADQRACFAVDLESKKYETLEATPIAQGAGLAAPEFVVSSSATQVKVCAATDDSTCTVLKVKAPKGQSEPIVAAVDGAGKTAVVMLGNAEAGKGVAEIWDVARNKKLATIKYARGDHKCGVAQSLGDVVYISASVCAGPAAKGALYTLKGKKLADVGGKDFGTYGARAVQVTETQWAFLEEGAGAVAVHDVKTGKVEKILDLVPLWSGAGGAERAGGNPGESALVRGGDGKLVVISGSPVAGNVGVVDVASGEIAVIGALACAGTDAPADEPAADEPAADEAAP